MFPDRLFNVGIAEANLVSIAAGLAIAGKISFASTYAAFIPGRCLDQISIDWFYGIHINNPA